MAVSSFAFASSSSTITTWAKRTISSSMGASRVFYAWSAITPVAATLAGTARVRGMATNGTIGHGCDASGRVTAFNIYTSTRLVNQSAITIFRYRAVAESGRGGVMARFPSTTVAAWYRYNAGQGAPRAIA